MRARARSLLYSYGRIEKTMRTSLCKLPLIMKGKKTILLAGNQRVGHIKVECLNRFHLNGRAKVQ